jgi:RNA polymerase sigma factor (sigma-70 family)
MDDAALVTAARQGDRVAYATLVGRHRGMVLGLCRRVLDDPALAEDAVQEAVLWGLLDLDRLREPRRFGSWLAGIGLNVCRRELRRRARDAGPVPESPDPGAGPAELAEAAEVTERVRRAVAALPTGQRLAVAGFYLQELSQAELAAALGIGVGAVKTRLHKARAALRGRLDDLVEGPAMTETLIPMRVADVHHLPGAEGEMDPHVVVLTEIDGDRRLPIWTGPAEAMALALALTDTEQPRPLTHRFAAGVLAACGGRVERCRITRLEEGTFYAEVLLDGPAGRHALDARPSDALNLALEVGAPIVVEPTVLDDASRQEGADSLPDLPEGGAIALATRWLTLARSPRSPAPPGSAAREP